MFLFEEIELENRKQGLLIHKKNEITLSDTLPLKLELLSVAHCTYSTIEDIVSLTPALLEYYYFTAVLIEAVDKQFLSRTDLELVEIGITECMKHHCDLIDRLEGLSYNATMDNYLSKQDLNRITDFYNINVETVNNTLRCSEILMERYKDILTCPDYYEQPPL